MLMLLALAAAGPVTGQVKTFGDWAVACDNVKRCEAASLPIPADGPPREPEEHAVSIVREPGSAGVLTITVDNGSPPRAAALHVDGKRVADGSVSGGGFTVSGAPAEAAARAMANGALLSVVANGKPIARASLVGMAATLRYIDAEQGRAGGVTALVARGTKAASTVPPARALPVVAQVRAGGVATPIGPKLAGALLKQAGCDGEYESAGKPIEGSAVGGGRTLALVPCGSGAYNFSSAPMILSGGKATRATFDLAPGFTSIEGGVPILVNAAFDPKTGRLTSYAKGRGIGDCGSAEYYVWDGAMFRLVEARQMGECRGSINWLTTWRARPVAR